MSIIRIVMSALAAVTFFTVVTTAGCTIVEPGYAGIKVDNLGDNKGVQDYPVRVGRIFYFRPTQDVYKFPTFLMTYRWTADKTEGSSNDDSFTVNSLEGAVMNFDASFSVAFVADSVPKLFSTFRQSPEHITHVFIRSAIQKSFSDAASTMQAVSIFGERKKELQDRALADARIQLAPYGIRLDQLNIVGKIRVDATVEKSINAVLSAGQRAIEAQNKVVQAQAEADQMVKTAQGDSAASVIRAKGQAEANRLLNASLSSNLIQYNQVNKWNGALPTVTGGGTPIIDFRERP